jgi:hypothetical protein
MLFLIYEQGIAQILLEAGNPLDGFEQGISLGASSNQK